MYERTTLTTNICERNSRSIEFEYFADLNANQYSETCLHALLHREHESFVKTRLFVKARASAFPYNICNFQFLLQNCSASKLGFPLSLTTFAILRSCCKTVVHRN